MTPEFALSLLAVLGVIALGVYILRQPTTSTSEQIKTLQQVVNEYQGQILSLRSDLEAQRRLVTEMSASMDIVLKRNFALFNELASVHDELQRVNAIAAWTRQQLRERNIELPQIPIELRESRLLPPSGVAIQVDQQSGGVRIDSSSVNADSDIIGGSKK